MFEKTMTNPQQSVREHLNTEDYGEPLPLTGQENEIQGRFFRVRVMALQTQRAWAWGPDPRPPTPAE